MFKKLKPAAALLALSIFSVGHVSAQSSVASDSYFVALTYKLVPLVVGTKTSVTFYSVPFYATGPVSYNGNGTILYQWNYSGNAYASKMVSSPPSGPQPPIPTSKVVNGAWPPLNATVLAQAAGYNSVASTQIVDDGNVGGRLSTFAVSATTRMEASPPSNVIMTMVEAGAHANVARTFTLSPNTAIYFYLQPKGTSQVTNFRAVKTPGASYEDLHTTIAMSLSVGMSNSGLYQLDGPAPVSLDVGPNSQVPVNPNYDRDRKRNEQLLTAVFSNTSAGPVDAAFLADVTSSVKATRIP
jgi:hypothetical protein